MGGITGPRSTTDSPSNPRREEVPPDPSDPWPLPSRAQRPRSSAGRDPPGTEEGRPGPGLEESGRRSVEEEIDDIDVLDLLDELADAFGQPKHEQDAEGTPSDGADAPAPHEESPAAPPPPGLDEADEVEATEPPPEPAGRPSPYLEERLAVAQRLLGGLRRESEEFMRRSVSLRWAVEALESEVSWASSEVEFARSHGLLGEAVTEVRPIAPPRASPAVATPRAPAVLPRAAPGATEAARSSDGRYREFTVQRYNATMGGLKRRRPTVVVVSLLVATIISAALVWIAFASHAPEPPLWLAVLPGIWMIPVPFFVLSFRGTQRILRRNHFDLPEVP